MPIMKDKIYEGGTEVGFNVVDVRDRAHADTKSVKECIVSSTPYVYEDNNGSQFPVYGYSETTMKSQGHIVVDEKAREQGTDTVELYADMRDPAERKMNPLSVKDYCPEGCTNLDYVQAPMLHYYGETDIVPMEHARAELKTFNAHSTSQAHVMDYEEYKDIKENIDNPNLVAKGFLPDASVTPDDYNNYLSHCFNQLGSKDFHFIGKIKSQNEIHTAYESCPELMSEASQPTDDKQMQ